MSQKDGEIAGHIRLVLVACQYSGIRVIPEINLDLAQSSERFEKDTKTFATVNPEAGSLVVLKERDHFLSGLIGDVRRFRSGVERKVHAENDDMAGLAEELK